MKKQAAPTLRRQVFVLTGEEKRLIAFVVVMLIAGVTVKHYRSAKGSPVTTTAISQAAATVSQPPQKSLREKRPSR